jgi:2-haloalkanoic acid dehalogenase type II
MAHHEHPWLTFDCYDTLVRYSEGKAAALAKLVRAKGGDDAAVDAAQVIFEGREREIQNGPFLSLSAVLGESLRSALAAAGLECTPADGITIIEAVCNADPFADVAPALLDLKRDHRLAILSNSEPEIIIHSITRIGVDMDAVILASEAECYKPAPGMFHALLDRIGESPENVTHIAQSFYHDIRPAKDLGFGRRIWINRYGRDSDAAYAPDAELMDLSGVREVLA